MVLKKKATKKKPAQKKKATKKKKRGNPNIASEGLKHTPWKKGVSGNPSGRAKGVKTMTKRFRMVLDKSAQLIKPIHDICVELEINPKKFSVGEVLALKLVLHAMDGNSTIAIEIINRIDGKIPDIVRQEIINGITTALQDQTTEQLRRVVRGEVKNAS